MMEVRSGDVKTLRLPPWALMLVMGEIRTRAESSMGFGDDVGEAASKHSAGLQSVEGLW